MSKYVEWTAIAAAIALFVAACCSSGCTPAVSPCTHDQQTAYDACVATLAWDCYQSRQDGETCGNAKVTRRLRQCASICTAGKEPETPPAIDGGSPTTARTSPQSLATGTQ